MNDKVMEDKYVVLVDDNRDVLDSYNVTKQAISFKIDRVLTGIDYNEYLKLQSQLQTLTDSYNLLLKERDEAVEILKLMKEDDDMIYDLSVRVSNFLAKLKGE
jgi:hypothetical protein